MTWTQANRSLRVYTPLGADKLLLVRLQGTESISQLFQFQLELLAENATEVAFDKLIGHPISVELDMSGGKKRFFTGICNRLSEGLRDADFTHYRMDVVPPLWLLTRRTQCRIFQQKTVPEILKEVTAGFAVKWDLKGKYYPRDYCVQYRESDFAFAGRLMEEEGIYYYFAHRADGAQCVVGDTPFGHSEVPEFSKAQFEAVLGGDREDMRITNWEKVQELRSGKVTLWDHCFELPGQHLEAETSTIESVPIGKVTHKLKLGNDKLELFDYPGAYAQRFDGIDPGGGDRASDLQRIFEDNARTAKIRMEQEAAQAVQLRGDGNCRQFAAGHKFTLERHFSGDGAYVLLEVHHDARQPGPLRGGDGGVLDYANRFSCLPAALPYRPPSRTQKSLVQGPQTATVVGPPGEAIHCDKYGRVKVKFHWDRHPGSDDNSSCWVRVSQNWGGAKWGGMFIPHSGQEVIVEFEEGDPDRPLITGRVYNAAAMPPGELPGAKSKSIIRDHGGNEIIMEGEGGVQQIRMHSPFAETTFLMGAPHSPGNGFYLDTKAYMSINVLRDWSTLVGGTQTWFIAGSESMQIMGSSREMIARKHTTVVGGVNIVSVMRNQFFNVVGVHVEQIGRNRVMTVGGFQRDTVKKNKDVQIGGDLKEITTGKHFENVGSDHQFTIKGEQDGMIVKDCKLQVGGDTKVTITGGLELKTGKIIDVSTDQGIEMEAANQIKLTCGSSSLLMKSDGTIELKGVKISIDASTKIEANALNVIITGKGSVEQKASMIKSKSTGMTKIEGPIVMIN